jgi:hypothetical protein
MKFTLVADPDECGDDLPCPKIWRTEDGRYWVQGARRQLSCWPSWPCPTTSSSSGTTTASSAGPHRRDRR